MISVPRHLSRLHRKLSALDHRYVWHPFTQMRDWLRREPIVIVRGRGAVLRDAQGKQYLDANSSIWTNLHGHAHRAINAAIKRQLNKIAHSSALGLANGPASLLAERLVEAANEPNSTRFSTKLATKLAERLNGPTGERRQQPRKLSRLPHSLAKVFFSDDGSTAMEVALKLAFEAARRTRGIRHPKFISLGGAYHGDTVGAMALGHSALFHKAYSPLLFRTDEVMSPYCYRCPFNRARPERADAREYRKCNWECVGKVEQAFERKKKRGKPYAAFVFEPLIQGAAGMIAQPQGWLKQATDIARGHGALLIADEVMTAFGRTGGTETTDHGPQTTDNRPQDHKTTDHKTTDQKTTDHGTQTTDLGTRNTQYAIRNTHQVLFACAHEDVQPDFMALAKGLTGGYLPMGATLATQEIFDAFLGDYGEFKSFFHGHSFTANQLGAAAALASLDILQSPASMRARARLETTLRAELQTLWTLPNVGDFRQVGLVAGIELVKDWRTREPFDLRDQAGARVCEAMAKRGVLTRPIGNVIVLMPPYCTTQEQLSEMVAALRRAVARM